jgi:hypothetical protein
MGKGVTAWQNLRLLKWCAQAVARVDLADVGVERAAPAGRIAGGVEEVVVGVAAVVGRVGDERRAAGPAADEVRGDLGLGAVGAGVLLGDEGLERR